MRICSKIGMRAVGLQDLTYSVKSHHDKKVTLNLLSSVSGFFNAGEMSALVDFSLMYSFPSLTLSLSHSASFHQSHSCNSLVTFSKLLSGSLLQFSRAQSSSECDNRSRPLSQLCIDCMTDLCRDAGW